MLAPMKISPAVAKKTLFQIRESGTDSNDNEEDSHILYIRETRLLLVRKNLRLLMKEFFLT